MAELTKSIVAERDGGIAVAEPPGTTVIENNIDLTHESLRPWQVIVYDDPVTPMDYVVAVFQKLFGFPVTKATQKMLEVHQTGRSVVHTGPKEECEFHVERLGSCRLTAGMEEA